MVDLSIVIVSYNVREHLARCLASIRTSLVASRITAETIVVDNASTDGSQQIVQNDFQEMQLVANPRNQGFTRANNQGIAQSRGRYILLLNPDTEVMNDALGILARYLDVHPGVGAVGPKLLWPDGAVQSSRRRFPSFGLALIESTRLQRCWPDAPGLRHFYCLDRSNDVEQDVDWLVGACLLVRRQGFEMVGLLDERFYMYYEELDWCRRLRHAGWRIVYEPKARVVHYEGRSSGQDLPHRHIRFAESKWLYFEKYYGRPAGVVLRAYLLADYGVQLAEEGMKWAFGSKRPLRRARLQLIYHVLRSGLRAT